MFAIAITDHGWFERHRVAPAGRFVNFWTPTPWNVKGLGKGDRVYFMLKSPLRKIGGYGIFSRYVNMTAADAWNTYGLANGVDSQIDLVDKVNGFAQKRADRVPTDNPLIGCIELEDVVMLDEDQFFDPNKYGHPFKPQIVKYKCYREPDRLAAHLDAAATSTPFALVAACRSASCR